MKKIINSQKAPAAIGPYNHAVVTHGLLFASGQIGINPETGDLVTDNIESETRQVMSNIAAILKEEKLTYDDIVKCTIFVKDMKQYTRINEVYAEYFKKETAPARELVEVRELPKHVNIEISIIATMQS